MGREGGREGGERKWTKKDHCPSKINKSSFGPSLPPSLPSPLSSLPPSLPRHLTFLLQMRQGLLPAPNPAVDHHLNLGENPDQVVDPGVVQGRDRTVLGGGEAGETGFAGVHDEG